MNRYVVFIGIGTELIGIIGGAVYLSTVLEEKYNFRGMSAPILILLGFAGWFLHVMQILRKFNSDKKSDSEQ